MPCWTWVQAWRFHNWKLRPSRSNPTIAPSVPSHLPRNRIWKYIWQFTLERNHSAAHIARLDKLHGHLRIHSGEKPYSSSQCSKSFTQPHGLQGHLRIHSKPYSCENCTKSFARSDKLKHHVKSGVCRKSAEFIGHLNTWWIPVMYRNYFAAFYFTHI